MRGSPRTNANLRRLAAVLLAAGACLAAGEPACGQRLKWHDAGFAFRRTMDLPPASESLEIVVCDFFTQGSLTAAAPSVEVYASRRRVAFAVLQIGPGDLCRVAFQPLAGESRYAIYYGGKGTNEEPPPAWAPRAGLLLETRRWKPCDLHRLDSVRQAFEQSERIGSDYVPAVFHRHNPFELDAAPFLTRYSGEIHVPLAGNCTFFTSSQDCSFLLIDGQQVVAAPGSHPPDLRARRSGIVKLAEGPHRFEYYHAAQGNEACMVAAWQLPGFDRPNPISPSVFRHERIAHLPADWLEHRDDGPLPDFRLAILGDLPFPDNAGVLVRVQFANTSWPAILNGAKCLWRFGDGQTSDQVAPAHVYLHPGRYPVTLQLARGSRTWQTTHQVPVTRQFLADRQAAQQEEKLAAYLELLENYHAAHLDPPGLVQLVRAYVEADKLDQAARAARAAFAAEAAGHTDQSRWAVVSLVGPLLRQQGSDPGTAAELWFAASRLIQRGEWRFASAVEAADLLLNDLLMPARVKPVLDLAAEHLKDATPETRSAYYRVAGDWHARSGNADEARGAYRKAEVARELGYGAAERNARRGAYSRSAEAYLRSNELDRARGELDRWQKDFPGDKQEGYLSYLLMRYWMARKKPDHAIAVAHDLLAVNPRSPYADQLVFLAARCEREAGRLARAAAAYQSLISEYPGSPLAGMAKKELEAARAGPATPLPAKKALGPRGADEPRPKR